MRKQEEGKTVIAVFPPKESLTSKVACEQLVKEAKWGSRASRTLQGKGGKVTIVAAFPDADAAAKAEEFAKSKGWGVKPYTATLRFPAGN